MKPCSSQPVSHNRSPAMAGAIWQPLRWPIGANSGWLLLRTRLWCQGKRGQTTLAWQAEDGTVTRCRLAVARSGRICELVKIPAGSQQLMWQPSSLGAACHMAPLQLRWVGSVERLWRTLRRTLPFFWNTPRQRRLHHRLTAAALFRSPAQAYRSAGELRDSRPLDDYTAWLQQHDPLSRADRGRIQRTWQRWTQPPSFCLHLLGSSGATDNTLHDIQRSLQSIQAQCYPMAAITVVTSMTTDTAWPFALSAHAPSGPDIWHWVIPAGSTLHPSALFRLAVHAQRDPALRWIYGDHDRLDEAGERFAPHFKPDWSPTLLQGQNYIGWCGVWRDQPMTMPIPDSAAALYQHWLQLGERLAATQIAHLPSLLMQVPQRQEIDAGTTVAVMHQAARQQQIKMTVTRHGTCRLHWPLPAVLPAVSIIVPTRNGLAHLQPCITSLFALTRYATFEVLIVDNQSDDPATLDYLRQISLDHPVRVLTYDHPFNYAAINNMAVEAAQGELVCLLNNDTEIISEGWLGEMVSHLLRPSVGVVGAKLYYSDGTIQHAGDAVGPGGCADHLHHRLPGDAAGYEGRLHCAQELSAVTGACLLTHKALYQQLGGLNAQDLPVAFNDVDYCLRVREAGQQVIWTPFAELYHHESVSRGQDETPERQARAARELAYMRQRWQQTLLHDPFYNPNLSYDRPDFSLNKAPRVARPWEH